MLDTGGLWYTAKVRDSGLFYQAGSIIRDGRGWRTVGEGGCPPFASVSVREIATVRSEWKTFSFVCAPDVFAIAGEDVTDACYSTPYHSFTYFLCCYTF